MVSPPVSWHRRNSFVYAYIVPAASRGFPRTTKVAVGVEAHDLRRQRSSVSSRRQLPRRVRSCETTASSVAQILFLTKKASIRDDGASFAGVFRCACSKAHAFFSSRRLSGLKKAFSWGDDRKIMNATQS